jgi:membrane-associated phospholipid phosphatase
VQLYARAGENGLPWFAVAGVAAAVDPAGRPAYLRAARVTLVALVANTCVKQLVRRPRPVLGPDLPALAPTISRLSYPSAHATTSFAAAGAFSRVLPRAPLYFAAVAMALSRPYLGVHYPTDVVAGALLGDAVDRLA